MQDYNELKKLMGDSFRELIAEYIHSSNNTLLALEKAIKYSKFDAIISSAHSIKSPSYQIGAKKLADVYARVEALGREKSCDELDSLLSEAKIEQALVIKELNKLN